MSRTQSNAVARRGYPTRPVALTIAGSDSGGGAGIQADLKTFTALGVHGTSVLTAVTAQNPRRVLAVHEIPPRIVTAQLRAVFTELRPAAIKTGMLYSPEVITAVARFLKAHGRGIPLVVDPVMVATSGAVLLRPEAVSALTRQLFPLATLLTPNLAEAEHLLGETISTTQAMHDAAQELHTRFGCAVLVKGGHLRGGHMVPDVLYDGRTLHVFRGRRLAVPSTHGTGCTLSAAITAMLAHGCGLACAVGCAKAYVSCALRGGYLAGGHFVLEHFH